MAAPAIGLRPKWSPFVTAHVDWDHPLAQGLVGFWVVGNNGFSNLVNPADRLPVNNTTSLVVGASTAWGRAAGNDINTTSTPVFQLTTPSAALQPADRVTLMWAGNLGVGSTNNNRLLSMEYNSTSGNPFIGYGLYRSATTTITGGYNTAGTFASTTAVTVAANTAGVATFTYDRTTATCRWQPIGGALTSGTNSSSGALTYSGPRLVVGNTANTASDATLMTAGAIWNRVLAAEEIYAINANPFQLLVR